MAHAADHSRPEEFWAALIPELVVADVARSISFYCGVCGFTIRYRAPEGTFAIIECGKAQIMLEAISPDAWVTGPLEPPFGRGINLRIEVPDVALLHDRLVASGARIFRGIETAWYRHHDVEHGQMEFLAQDPDGYLLRFMQVLGRRPAPPQGPA